MGVNTTRHLIRDIERLRLFLALDRWLLFGHFWGCTLALLYAEAHPERVSALVLAGITMTRPSEIDWLYRGMAPLFPAEWSRFRLNPPNAGGDHDLVAAYHHLLQSPEEQTRLDAAKHWHEWEGASILIDPESTLPRRWANPAYPLTRARIITHYFHHRAWIAENQILRDIDRLAGIRAIMVHGRMDLEAPLCTAWELSQAWPEAKLIVVAKSAHSPSSDNMAAAIIGATDSFFDG